MAPFISPLVEAAGIEVAGGGRPVTVDITAVIITGTGMERMPVIGPDTGPEDMMREEICTAVSETRPG